jgi:hypothetical protein
MLDGESRVFVIQLQRLEHSLERTVTEFLLWNLIGFVESVGPAPMGCFVVLDEAHKLAFVPGSPAEKLLREEGRLFRGATAYPRGRGVWRDDERGGTLLTEEPIIIFSYVAEPDLTSNALSELYRIYGPTHIWTHPGLQGQISRAGSKHYDCTHIYGLSGGGTLASRP